MDTRVHVITLGVVDLERSLAFYRDGLGLPTRGIIGKEFAGDTENAAGAVVMFQLNGGRIFALYPRTELAKDANVLVAGDTTGGFSLGHAVPSRTDVDALIERAVAAGATSTGPARDRPWGIYSGYFRDPDGHLWEIMRCPQTRRRALIAHVPEISDKDFDRALRPCLVEDAASTPMFFLRRARAPRRISRDRVQPGRTRDPAGDHRSAKNFAGSSCGWPARSSLIISTANDHTAA